MALPNTYNRGKNTLGFTLIELLVVISITIVLLSLGLFISFDSFRRYLFRSEKEILVSVLEKARSRAVNNLHQSSHGVCYDDGSRAYIIFRGNSYSSNDLNNEIVASNKSAVISGFPLCRIGEGIVFSQLTGNTRDNTITINQDEIINTVITNIEGRIDW